MTAMSPQETPRVDIEDVGPALEAIASKAYGEQWATFSQGSKSLHKQELLDLLLPGLQIILDQANEQLAAALAAADDQPQPDGYCPCRGLPERTCGIRLHRLSAGADQ